MEEQIQKDTLWTKIKRNKGKVIKWTLIGLGAIGLGALVVTTANSAPRLIESGTDEDGWDFQKYDDGSEFKMRERTNEDGLTETTTVETEV